VRGREPRDHVGMLELLAPALRERVRRDPDESVRIGGSVRRNQMRLLTGKHLAQRTTNWALIGARYGLGFAFPLLDRRIVEFAISLPSTWHQRDGWKRRPFRDAMEGVLPPLIQWRHSKLTPFPDTLLEMSTRKRLLLERVEELSRHEFVHQILDVDQMRRMIVSLPEPEVRVRSTSLAATIPFVLISAALQYARYVEEHF
jgi:asparagine synthase (glutamine-hydrolysing)